VARGRARWRLSKRRTGETVACRSMSSSAKGATTCSRRLCGVPMLRHHGATGVAVGN